MIQLWRPQDTDWGNRWPAEDDLNKLVAAGWKIIGILPPCDYSQHPTFVLQNRTRWRDRGWMPWYRYWWWRFGLWWNRARTQRELAEYEARTSSGNVVGSRGEEP